MTDRALIVVKVGDKTPAANKQHMSLKEGSIVTVIDESEWSQSIEDIVSSQQMHKVYAMGFVDPAIIPFLKSIDGSIGDINDTVDFRLKSKIITLDKLADKTPGLGIAKSTLIENWRSIDPVWDIWDWTGIIDSDFTDAATVNNTPEIYDSNAVSSGSYTVGSAQDYANLNAAFADIANLTGNLTFTQETNTTESGKSTLSESLNGYTLTVNNSTSHDGEFATGNIVSHSGTDDFVEFGIEGSGTLDFKNLSILKTGTSSSTNRIIFMQVIQTSFDMYIHDLMIDCDSKIGRGIHVNDNTPSSNFYNIICKDVTSANFYTTQASSGCKMENITSLNSASAGFSISTQSPIIRNCVDFGSVTGFTGNSSATGYNNASEDTTAQDSNWNTSSDNITGIDSGDISADGQISVGSALNEAGSSTTISGHTKYINGIDIQAQVDIGAWGAVADEKNNTLFFGSNF